MEALYARADAVVLPSLLDAVPITLIEALTKGLPCVSTTAGNMKWLIDDAGEVVEPGRVDALAGALRKLVAHYPSYRERALARGAYMREHFRWGTVAARILDDVM
jgi:glycosyltransferase involved in cell wall biosynthesis